MTNYDKYVQTFGRSDAYMPESDFWRGKTYEPPTELVHHPAHYNRPNRKECIVEMREKFGDDWTYIWCLLTEFKYQYREDLKDGDLDREKAAWYADYAAKLAESMQDAPSSRLMPLWIPADTKLPESSGDYLVTWTTQDGIRLREVLYYDADCCVWTDLENASRVDVTAWMPLPEPYKAESEGDSDDV